MSHRKRLIAPRKISPDDLKAVVIDYCKPCQQTADNKKRNGDNQTVFDVFLIETKDLRKNQTGASERRIARSDRTYDHAHNSQNSADHAQYAGGYFIDHI